MQEKDKFSEALTLLNWIIKAGEKLTDVKKKLSVMKRCSRAIWEAALKMKRKKQEAQSWCFYYTAACFQYVRKYSNVCHHSHNAIDLMKDVFGSDYKKYRVVGLSHAITGEAWKSMKSYNYAMEEYKSALEVFENAQDIKSAMYRKSCVNYEKTKVTRMRQAVFLDSLPKRQRAAAARKFEKQNAVTEANNEILNASGHMELLSLNNDE